MKSSKTSSIDCGEIANPDPRCFPLVTVVLDQLQSLLSPALKGAAIAGVELVEGGLTNTIYRITPAEESDQPRQTRVSTRAPFLLDWLNPYRLLSAQSLRFSER
jgi:hypothetical protein